MALYQSTRRHARHIVRFTSNLAAPPPKHVSPLEPPTHHDISGPIFRRNQSVRLHVNWHQSVRRRAGLGKGFGRAHQYHAIRELRSSRKSSAWTDISISLHYTQSYTHTWRDNAARRLPHPDKVERCFFFTTMLKKE